MMCSCDLLTGAKTCDACNGKEDDYDAIGAVTKQLEGCKYDPNFVVFDLQQQIDKGFVLLEKLRDARIEALVRFGDLERDEIPRQFFILFDKKALT